MKLGGAAVRAENRTVRSHSLAYWMRHESGGRVHDLECAVDLVAADALPAGNHQVVRLDTLVHGDVAVLKDDNLDDAKLLPALATLPQAVPLNTFRFLMTRFGLNTFDWVRSINTAAIRAGPTILPNYARDVCESCATPVHLDVGKNGQTERLKA